METIEEAKQFLKDNWEKGVKCPCCKRLVMLYEYPFNSSMARMMIMMYRAFRENRIPVHIENEALKINFKGNQVQSKLTHWGLINPVENTDPEKRMSGFYNITKDGISFVEGKIKVPKKIKYYNYDVYWRSEKLITIQEGLGVKFNYQEMMGEYLNNPQSENQTQLF